MNSSTAKRLGGLIGAGLMGSVVLAGCGGPAAAAPKGKSAPITVTFWTGLGGSLGTKLQNLVNEFNKTHPGIHVVRTYEGSYTGGGPEQQKLLASLAAHNPPDMAQLEVHSLPVFASVGALMPLTSFIKHSAVDSPSSLLPGMMVSTTYKGTTYALPFNRSVPVIFYNKTMFAKAGLSGPPNTWSQLMSDAAKLTHGSGSSKVYGFSPNDQWWFWEYYTWSSGQHILSPNLTRATFNTPAAESMLKDTANMQKQGTAIVQEGPHAWGLTTASFIAGKVAMDEDSPASLASVRAGVGSKFKWGLDMMPKNVTRAVPPGGANMVIMNGIPKATAKAAFTFMQWMTSLPQTIKWSEETGYLPVQKAALTNPGYEAYLKANPQERVVLNEVKYQHAPPQSPHYIGVYGYAQTAMTSIYANGASVSSAMNTAAKQSDTLLSELP